MVLPRKGEVVPDNARHRGWKKPTLSEQIQRRDYIKKLVVEEKISNREEIRRRLLSDKGWLVSRPTVDNDFRVIGRSPLSLRDARGFTLDLLATYRSRIGELELMISNSRDVGEKAMLMKTQSQLMKDMGVVAGGLASRGNVEDGLVRAQGSTNAMGSVGRGARTVVLFGEPRVVKKDDKGEGVKEDEDKS